MYPGRYQELLGIKIARRDIGIALGLCVIFFLLSRFLIEITLAEKGYYLSWGYWLDYMATPFQALNEEFVFRALLLTALLQLGVNKWKSIFIPALIFTIFHWIFYHFNMTLENRGDLDIAALSSIFLFGVATNSIFLATRSVAIPWALHCGWNLNRFGSKIIPLEGADHLNLREYMTFNLLEGAWPIMLLSLLVAATSVFYFSGYSRCKMKT